MDSKDINGCLMDKHKPVVTSSLVCEKVEDHVNGEDDSDSNSLLPPRRGGMSRNCEKTRRKVQWNDRNGNKLAEVLEYEPRKRKEEVDMFLLFLIWILNWVGIRRALQVF
ncbi:hypothetical protein JHK86_028209 [Glycine max]|nr:hypothetical protein JHK86_028209 [Glycine max]